MKILIIGSGGREHAIAWAIYRSNPEALLYCAPGNAGIAQLAHVVPIGVAEQDALLQFAAAEKIDLTVVGPEAPLAEGLVDAFEANRLRVFGPSQQAANLEASKAFAKEFMARNDIPTAKYRVADSASSAIEILRSGEFGKGNSPVVIKADGLAAGKGVLVAQSIDEAETALQNSSSGSFAGIDRHRPFVIEEALVGKEASILIFADGKDYVLMPAARDHKRIGEHETGPNTGGMGSITDDAVVDAQTLEQIRRQIIEPTLSGTSREGFPFKGILFFGLMLTNDGPKVLEFNVRFGDPETQAIMMRITSDPLALFEATIDGRLGTVRAEWSGGASACVVLANRGYPGKYETGAIIRGLPEAAAVDGVQVFHAGTAKSKGGEFVASGGRVLGVSAAGASLDEALSRCYSAVVQIGWEGMQFRRDIGRFV
jgi:phosphoribosylamine---glycine ligase